MRQSLLLFAFLFSGLVYAQNKVGTDAFYYQSFDNMKPDSETTQKEVSTDVLYNIRTLYQPVYSEGISGQALDLTENVPFRIPYALEPNECPSYGENSSFSIVVWVKTLKGARQGTPVMTNKKAGEKDSVGWCIGTQDNGAWYWNISDGKTTYDYEPTAERQVINDGEWHQIAVSVNRKKQEMWMYLDGKNVAVYRLETRVRQGTDSLESVVSHWRTVIGGSDEYAEPDHHNSRREWMAFNGKIDEVKIWTRPISSSEVLADYTKYKPSLVTGTTNTPDRLKVQVWNIWHGGHRFGQHVGVARTAKILKEENADIIGLIETYGSGAILADTLGYYFYLLSSNLSILSRYPITETIRIYQSFFSGGVLLDLGNNQKLAFFDTWLWYADNGRRLMEIKSILSDMEPYIKQADNVPVIMVGDFNTHSHLDVIGEEEIAKLPVTQEVLKAGFGDSYREIHPDPLYSPGFTWTPYYNEQEIAKKGSIKNWLRRIDFIFYKGKNLKLYNSEKIDHHHLIWPSDHAGVVSYFYLNR